MALITAMIDEHIASIDKIDGRVGFESIFTKWKRYPQQGWKHGTPGI